MRTTTILLTTLALGGIGCFQVDFMFFPNMPLDSYELPDNHIPEDQLELVHFDTVAGETIYGYWAYSDNYPDAHTILYCHGNHHHLDHYWNRVQLLWDHGYTVFAFDYPGYGMSTGEPTEDGLYRSADEAHAHVTARLSTGESEPLGADALDVTYYGWSLGSAPAIYLAAEVDEPRALVTEAAMASGQAFVEDSTGLALPSSMITSLELDNIGRIPYVDAPKLFIHGAQDDYIAPYFSEMLYDAADTPKRLWLSETAEHGNVVCNGATDDCEGASEESYEVWRDLLLEFVEDAAPTSI